MPRPGEQWERNSHAKSCRNIVNSAPNQAATCCDHGVSPHGRRPPRRPTSRWYGRRTSLAEGAGPKDCALARRHDPDQTLSNSTSLFARTMVGEIDLAQPIPDLRESAEGGAYSAALVLVRRHTVPLGYVRFEFSSGDARDRLADAIETQLAPRLDSSLGSRSEQLETGVRRPMATVPHCSPVKRRFGTALRLPSSSARVSDPRGYAHASRHSRSRITKHSRSSSLITHQVIHPSDRSSVTCPSTFLSATSSNRVAASHVREIRGYRPPKARWLHSRMTTPFRMVIGSRSSRADTSPFRAPV